MKNLMKKIRKSNKGFTLVELIIVIAVIAVLSAVVAPQYIKYVERSRQGMDASMLQEVKHVVEIEAATTETIAADTTFTVTINADKSVTLTGANSFASTTDAYKNVQTTCGTLTAKSAKSAGAYTMNISTGGAVAWANEAAITTLQNGAKS